jgi:long-chain fatty acid transport protein
MKALRSAVVVLAATAGTAHAAGFAIDTQSARATGMAQAVTALVDDPSAVFYNPAGIATGKGFSLQVGDTPILAGLRFTPDGGSVQSMQPRISPPPHAFLRYGILEDIAVGVGLSTPFGASSSWEEGWMGRTATTGSSMAMYDINPTLAMSFFDKRLRVGLGFRLVTGTVVLNRDLRFSADQFGSVAIKGAGTGEGFSMGLQLDVLPKLVTLGASYRSGVDLPFKGHADFDNVPAEFQGSAFDQEMTSTVNLPATARAGLGVRPTEALNLAFDVVWTEWSRFQSLDFYFERSGSTSTTPKNWHNTTSFHLGGEYALTKALDVRAGFSFDPTPSPLDTLSPDLPDSDRYRVAVGAGYDVLDNLKLDVGYQFIALKETQSEYPAQTGLRGTYGGNAHVLSLTLGLAL